MVPRESSLWLKKNYTKYSWPEMNFYLLTSNYHTKITLRQKYNLLLTSLYRLVTFKILPGCTNCLLVNKWPAQCSFERMSTIYTAIYELYCVKGYKAVNVFVKRGLCTFEKNVLCYTICTKSWAVINSKSPAFLMR